MTEARVPVLVVGGSLVGLSASLLLAARGVKHLLVERHRGTAIHPRAASFHQRTLEIFRDIGLQRAVEDAAASEFVQNGAIVAVDSLGGRELACFYRSYNDGVESLSPTSRLFITQVGLEPVLRERAGRLGADHHYGTELVSFEQDADEVVAMLRPREGGPLRQVRAQYLIAADGAHSAIRRRLGIAMTGRGSFADCVTIYFKADLRPLIGGRNLSVVYVNNPSLLGFFRFAIDGDAGFLAVFAAFDSRGGRDPEIGEDLSIERCAALVRTALGTAADFPVVIDNLQPWSAAAATAAAYRDGRVFLAGDAAHVMPPTGGFGGNTGVGDVHNLAWKLAMVLDGSADPALLDSYEAERRPVGEMVVEQAYARYVARVDPSLPAEGLAPMLDDAAIELGPIYRSDAIIEDEPAAGAKAGPVEDPRAPSGRPGIRLPHVELRRGATTVSTLDLAGPGFVLIAGARGQAWKRAAEEWAANHVAELAAVRVGPEGDLADPAGRLEDALGIAADGAVLVRPDGVVGWRSRSGSDAPGARLDAVMRRLLGRRGSKDD